MDEKVQYPPKSKQVDDDAAEIPASGGCSIAQVEKAFAVLEGRWKLLILFHLFDEQQKRFSVLNRAIPAISQKMLIQQLRELERDGVVQRTVYPEVPPKVEYQLTANGRLLRPSLEALMAWSQATGASGESG